MNAELKPRKRDPHVCMRCKSREVAVEHYSDVLDFKGLTLEVEGLARTRCKSCDFTWTTAGQEQDNLTILRNAYAAKRDAVRDREGLLTAEQIEHVLAQLKLSKSEAAELFGGGPNAFGKYISGEVLQSYAMDRLLRLTLAFGEQAVALLKQGRDAPLSLNCGYKLAKSSVATRPVIAAKAVLRGTCPATWGTESTFSSGEHADFFVQLGTHLQALEVIGATSRKALTPPTAARWFAATCRDHTFEVEEESYEEPAMAAPMALLLSHKPGRAAR